MAGKSQAKTQILIIDLIIVIGMLFGVLTLIV